ncbi:hypothetical protein H4219_001990 [Mycoemilia scoparia]|uniref:Ribosome maturation protein SDO1/SBDS N-terminal domain-containing protein n=1 Tax=Mycoemilia scoparia TaxID=417184 RepID=A0A9W8A6S9_9FUNG|nr:hypothetical protein H4219_001990 [Mycoemilia scoparia]
MHSGKQNAAEQVSYKVDNNEFIIYAIPGQTQKWKKDSTIPLVEVVESFDIFDSSSGGNSGIKSRPSKGVLMSAFNTDKDVDIVTQILKNGQVKGAVNLKNNYEK